jgi:hypothetical protein
MCWTARRVAPSHGTHLICHCDDCQAFAHELGRAAEFLDPNGGTEAYQTSPARIEFSAGADRLACLRLSPNGLLRWYASCCRTPIANTLPSRQLPFVALIQPRVAEPDRRARDAALGPVQARLFKRFAVGDRERLDAHDRVPAWVFARLFRLVLAARLRGDHARSPFFAADGAPVATPQAVGTSPTARG